MKIAIPSDDRETIARHFGRVAGFEVIEVEDDSITSREYRENQFSGHSNGNHADKHASILDTISDCDVVISNGMGHPMFAHLQKSTRKSLPRIPATFTKSWMPICRENFHTILNSSISTSTSTTISPEKFNAFQIAVRSAPSAVPDIGTAALTANSFGLHARHPACVQLRPESDFPAEY